MAGRGDSELRGHAPARDPVQASCWRRFASTAMGVLAAGLLGGCALAHSTAKSLPVGPEIIRSSDRFQKEYLLFEGDTVEVSVWRSPEVSRTVMVRPDGYISLPLLQEVKAAGLTPRELAESVRTRLAGRLVDPEVTIIPVTVRQPMIYVLGDVHTPGAFPLRVAGTAAQAIAQAGGALRSAAYESVTVIRLSEAGYLEAIPVRGGSHVSQPQPFLELAATQLKSDDIVFIPESGRSQVVRLLNDVLVPFQIYLNYKLIKNLL